MWLPHSVTCPARKPSSAWAVLRSQSSYQEPAPAQGPPQTAVWICILAWSSVDCRDPTYFIMVLCIGCWRMSAPAPGAHPLPPSPLILVSTVLFMSHFSRSSSSVLLYSVSYPFLNICHRGSSGVTDGSTLAILEPAGTDSVQHGAQTLFFSIRSYLCSPPHYQNLAR